MAEFDLASGTDLVRWADRLESRSRLPHLVRRLISATGKDLVAVSFRTGEGVQLPGWDGIVEAKTADTHVPSGVSVWEMGVDRKITSKANGDYEKRTKDPKGFVPAETTFVFITPRRWSSKESWVADRNAEGVWKEVRAYDGDDLEYWLERAPGAHAWFSALIGKDPYEIESLETWWESWSRATVPPVPPKVLLSGRENRAEAVRTLVPSGSSPLTLAGDSQEEVVAFIAAALQGIDETSEAMGRAVIVRTPGAWRRMAVSEHPLVLLPLFNGPDVALAVRSGHHVIIPLGREVGASAEAELPRLRRDGIEAALTEAGIPRERASRLATLGRRSLLSLRRTLAMSRAIQVPEWSRPEHVRDIIAAVLAGRWVDGSEGDRKAVSRLAGRPYEDVANALVRWSNTSDPPVRRVGDVWFIAAKQDAWTLVTRHLTPDDLLRFREVATKVLGEEDPSLDLTPRERIMAPLVGKTRAHSGHLEKGIANTLALMGAVSDAVPLANGSNSQDEATIIVAQLLRAANEDPSGRRWITISDSLPALAEAAPEEFLRAVETGLQGEMPLAAVFQDQSDGFDPVFNSSSAHTGLLWALETLAWSPDYLIPASLALAKLARIDPGGRLLNRPANSLREVFVLWHPGTASPLDRRLQAVDLIRKREPDVAWDLLLRLIPSGHDVAHPPHSPDWRDWKPDDTKAVSYADLNRAVVAVSERVLSDVGENGYRWASVVSRYSNFPLQVRDQIVEGLTTLDPSVFSSDERRAIAEAVRNLVSRHRSYPEKEWALPAAELDRLQECGTRLAPSDPTHQHRWLFAQGAVWSFRDENGRTQLEALIDAQTQAVAEVYASGGVAEILTWSEQFEAHYGPFEIGRALGGASIAGEGEEEILQALDSESAHYRQLARGFVTRRVVNQGKDWERWAAGFLAAHEYWSPVQKAEFLAALPAIPSVWDLAEGAGQEAEREYWRRMQYYGLPDKGEACIRAAEKLIEHGRPHTAVDLLDLYADEIPDGPPDELVADALEKAATTELTGPVDQMFTHHVGEHLDRLAAHSFDEDRLATLEWMYLPLFRFDKRKSLVLHRALASDPAFFVQVVSWVYPAEGEEPGEISEAESARSHTAHDLLGSWKGVPGILEDGPVDGDQLRAWVQEARRLLAEENRLEVGDHRIGRMLRYGPPPQEDEWPCEPIRDVIEDCESEALEDAFRMEVYNSRGTTVRAPTEGGAQERDLVARYRRYAAFAATAWPRTSAVLNRVADSFEHDARRHDLDADLTEDLWR